MKRAIFWIIAGGVFVSGVDAAAAGPCTADIASFALEIHDMPPGPDAGPSAPQSVDAQLHHQPTPGDVVHAEHGARADVHGALERARTADAAGDAAACGAALDQAKKLYLVGQ